MDISVIIPAHNEVGTIERLLQSLQRQEFERQAFEIIVVADRCTDQTVAAAQRFQVDQVVEGVFNSPAAARNAGAGKARGRILLFLDADVILPTPTFLTAVLNQAREGVVGTCLATPQQPGFRARLFWVVRNGFKKLKWARDSNSMLFVDRRTFRSVGGYKASAWPFEYYDFIQAARKQGTPYVFLSEPAVAVSMRRYEGGGYARTILWWLGQIARYNLGMKVQRPKPVEVWERERWTRTLIGLFGWE